MRTIVVPDIGQTAIKLFINSKEYVLYPGESAEVPNEVADVLDFISEPHAEETREALALDPVNVTDEMTQPVGRDADGKLFTKPAKEYNYNPVSKTSAMTQQVGVDSTGKLFTEPAHAAADVADATEDTILTQLNTLLSNLRAAGILSST